VELHCDTSHSLIAATHSLFLPSFRKQPTDPSVTRTNPDMLSRRNINRVFSAQQHDNQKRFHSYERLYSPTTSMTILLGSLPTLTTKDHRTRPLFLFSHLGPEISTDHFHQINHQEIIIRSSRRTHLFGIPVNLPINPQHKLSQLAVLPSRQPSAHPGHNRRDCLPLNQQTSPVRNNLPDRPSNPCHNLPVFRGYFPVLIRPIHKCKTDESAVFSSFVSTIIKTDFSTNHGSFPSALISPIDQQDTL
jgi:hypothetical protein